MSRKKKNRGPSAAEEQESAKAYWENYSQWKSDANKTKEKRLGDIRARYAGQDALGKTLMDAEISKYNDEMEGLRKGEHGTALNKYYEKQKGMRGFSGGDDMESFYKNLFGDSTGGNPEEELESDKRARISGSGGMWQ